MYRTLFFYVLSRIVVAGAIFILLAGFAVSVNASYIWDDHASAGSRIWMGVSVSSNGAKIAAVPNNGYVYTSTDGGITWTERTTSGSRSWTSIASSEDGSILAATVYNGYIYTSTDSGATWTERTGPGTQEWNSIAMSEDGTKMIAGAGYFSTSRVYISTDTGATWTQDATLPVRRWVAVASSGDGSVLAAAPYNGKIYVSTDSATSWTETTSPSTSWNTISMSSDGAKIAALGEDTYVNVSTDTGDTWTQITALGTKAWATVSYAPTGSAILAGVGWNEHGSMYVSNDDGATWKEQFDAGTGQWFASAQSSDGSILVAAKGNTAHIYTSEQALFAGGDGTAENPYQIRTCEGLQAMQDERAAHYELTGNVNCIESADWNAGEGFEPVAQSGGHFSGSLNGNGYSISDLTIDTGDDINGLFGYLDNATIEDFTLEDITVTGDVYTGAVAGYAQDAIFDRVYIEGGEITGVDHVGGFGGSIMTSTITNSGTDATVTGTGENTGGFVGQALCTSTYDQSYATGDVSGNVFVGGFAGNDSCLGAGGTYTKVLATGNVHADDSDAGGFFGTASLTTITDAFAMGDVDAGMRAGGFIGIANGGVITNAYSKGLVTAGTNFNAFIGEVFEGPPTITSSFVDTDTAGAPAAYGVTGKTTDEMNNSQTFLDASWDFDDIWYRKDAQNDGYPYLQFFYNETLPIIIHAPETESLQALHQSLEITFTIEEDMEHESLAMYFVPHFFGDEVEVYLMDAPAGTPQTFHLDPEHISLAPEVISTSVEALSEGVYNIAMVYQDVEGNPAASDTITEVRFVDEPVLTTVDEIPSLVTKDDAIYIFQTSEACEPFAEVISASIPGSYEVHIEGTDAAGEDAIAYISGIKVGGTYSVDIGCFDDDYHTVQSNTLTIGPFTVISDSGSSGGRSKKWREKHPIIAPPVVTVTQPTTPVPAVLDIHRTLKFTMTGEDVRALQAALNKAGFAVAATGPGSQGNETVYFGQKTLAAIKKFQHARALVVDGIVGPKTIAALAAM